jgi:hypothetical protein
MRTARLFNVFIAMCFGCLSLFAQDSISVIGKFIEGHPWTMDFSISSNLTLSNFQGASISLGQFTSDYQKNRIGISTSVNCGTSDQSGNNLTSDVLTSQSKQNSESNRYSIQVIFQRLTYATPNAHTSLYYGIGPLMGIGWNKNTSSSSSNYVSGSQNWSSSDGTGTNYSLGVLGSLGVEWFFSEHMSLHAEYGLTVLYTWSKSESTSSSFYLNPGSTYSSSKSNSSSKSSGWSLTGQSVLFGLSVNY